MILMRVPGDNYRGNTTAVVDVSTAFCGARRAGWRRGLSLLSDAGFVLARRRRVPQRPSRRLGAGGAQISFDPCDDFRMRAGHVVGFAGIGRQLVQLQRQRSLLADRLPVAHAHRLLGAALVELPVEKFVGPFLLASEQGGYDGVTVEARGHVGAGQFGGGGQEVPEGPDLIADGSGWDAAGPSGDHGHADAAFVEGAFDAAQRAGAAEEGGIDTALAVG